MTKLNIKRQELIKEKRNSEVEFSNGEWCVEGDIFSCGKVSTSYSIDAAAHTSR